LIFENAKMSQQPLASYLKSHRMKSGMSQRELADLIGILADHQISKHERSATVPSLLAALSYQVVFSVPITELFPGIYESVRMNLEERLCEMETELQNSTAKGRGAHVIARKLEWLLERRDPASFDLPA
jgi:DNA-binding XRE family transcriptional regulator